MPQVTQIFLRLKQMGLDIDTDVYTIPYAVKTVCRALEQKRAAHPAPAEPARANRKGAL